MFDEMRAMGLPEPVFYRNNFMLQTIVRNGEAIKSIDTQQGEFKEKVSFEEQKVPIELIEKFLIDKSISEIMKNSIIDLYNALEGNRVFGRKEVSEILDYSDRNTGKIILIIRTHQNTAFIIGLYANIVS